MRLDSVSQRFPPMDFCFVSTTQEWEEGSPHICPPWSMLQTQGGPVGWEP